VIVEFIYLLGFYGLGLGFVVAVAPLDASALQRAALAPALGLGMAVVLAFVLALIPGGFFQRLLFDLTLVTALIAVWIMAIKRSAFRIPDQSSALVYAIVPVLLVGLLIFQERVHLAVLTYDSHRFVGFATDIADNSGDLFNLNSLSMATGYPLPLALGLSMGILWEGDYFRLLPSYFTLPIVICIPVVLLLYMKDIGINLRDRMVITGVFSTIVLTTGAIIYFTFYINSSMPTAGYLLSAATAIWFYLRRGDRGWLAIAALLIVLLGTMRLEAPMISFLLMLFMAGLRSDRLDRPFFIFIFATSAGLISWLAFLYFYASGGSIINPVQILGMIFILACLPFGISLLDRIAFLRRYAFLLPILAVVGLALLLILFSLLQPASMYGSFAAMLTNMFWYSGMWTGAWPGMLILSMLLFVLRAKLDHSSLFFGAIFLSVLLLIFDLAFFRAGIPYRIGFGDSGNRMLLHIVPIGWLTLGLISARLWARRKEG
jgi:hypothetical protein